jgi:predicted HicB family RNase H-like nuclease
VNNALEYKGYFSSVIFSNEGNCFFGKILGINDLVTFEGTTVQEIKAAFQEAVDDYLLMCEQAGKEPEKVYKGSFNVRIDPELHKKASILAQAEHISLNQFIELSVAEKVNKSYSMKP